MPTDPFLNDFGRDLLTSIGGIGFILTAIGVWLAWIQIKKTNSATQAAIEALNHSRFEYNRYIINECSRLLSEGRVHSINVNWNMAAVRLSDIANLLNQLDVMDSQWRELSDRTRSMGKSFEKIHANKSSISDNMKGKWNKLDSELSSKISEHLKPFGTKLG
ncbi:hypothetical protein [Rubinisphaera italica]|uniref:Uncharacterized protein n=1 Tax=Rubinisphaera italica TaxID=2527969 RepID=A0A5C5XG06_9PLAN|nr:hypothetical protein [Rubinisphaera italica]TWT61940.1 hypothetical protein Pan54_26770 [Rubinisphaera italica]